MLATVSPQGAHSFCQCTLASLGLTKYPAVSPTLTSAEIMARTRLPSPGVGAALTIVCMYPVVMSWQMTVPMTGTANRSHSRFWV
jgi:hypothetical protein